MNKLTSLLVGGALGAAAIAGTTSPVVLDLVLARSPQVAEDLSGPCDELEHAGDPRCPTIDLTAPAVPSSSLPRGPIPPSTMPSGTVPSGTAPSTSAPSGAGPMTTAPATSGPQSTAPSATPQGVAFHQVADAGSVSIVESGGLVTVTGVRPAEGWSFTIQQNGTREAEVIFRRGSERVDFKAEFEDGAVRIRIRDRRGADGSGAVTPETIPSPRATTPTPTIAPRSTSTTIDDRGRGGHGDDDRGRGGHGDDDRGRGGHGDDDRGRGGHGDDDRGRGGHDGRG